MDLKRYKKTRYQNIYKSIKKQNYIVVIPGTHTTISTDEKGNKIFDIEKAIKIRDNKKLRVTKKSELTNNNTFKDVWYKYYKWCEDNLEYNTLKKKRVLYNAFFYKFNDENIARLKKEEIENTWRQFETTNKEKNRLLIDIRAFFNWCVKNRYIPYNPTSSIQKLKAEKSEMKYWLPEHLKAILDTINEDIENGYR